MIEVGQPAPDGELPDIHGTPVRWRGLGVPSLLVFLPAAFSPLCSNELSGLRRIAPAVRAAGAQTYAVACDSMFALRAWTGDATDELRVLSDFWPHGEVSRRYEAFDDARGIATRTSYLLDDDGVVRWSTSSPAGVGRDLDAHLAAVERLAG